MQKYVPFIFVVLIATAINVGITRFMMDDLKSSIITGIDTPNLVILDQDALFSELQNQVDTQSNAEAQMMADWENIITAFRLQNYIVLDSKHVMGYSPRHTVQNIDMEEVRRYLRSRGAPLSTSENHVAKLEEAQALVRKLFPPLSANN